MKSNKEILREYLEIGIKVDLLEEVIAEVSAKGQSVEEYEEKLRGLRVEMMQYETRYYWIAFISRELDTVLSGSGK